MTADLWDRLGGVLLAVDRAGTDVIVDVGRLGMAGGPDSLLRQVHAVLLVMRTSLDAVVSARARIGWLHGLVAESASGVEGLGLLLVGEGRPYRAGEVAKAIGAPVVATVSHDEPNAHVLSHGVPRGRRFDTSPLVRSARRAADEIQRLVLAHAAHLAPPMTDADGAGEEEVTSDQSG